MAKKSDITKAKLVETAKELFLEKGFDGLKMQELADKAAMNKGLLHYYFKSKQALFQAIFQEALEDLFSGVVDNLVSDKPLDKKMDILIDLYFDKLIANPGLPVFILSELHKNPGIDGLPNILKKAPILMDAIKTTLPSGMEQTKFLNLFLTVVSLSVFPFVARPLFSKLLSPNVKFKVFMEQRRVYVKKIITQLIEEL